MNASFAKPGETIEVRSLGTCDAQEQTTLIKTADLEVIRLVLPAGRHVPTHEGQGEILVYCVEGQVSVTARDNIHELSAGQLLYLILNEPFSLKAVENSCLLVTINLPREGRSVNLIGEQVHKPARRRPK